MIIQPYKVLLYKDSPRHAFIIDDEGIVYFEFKPHPDGDPWMDKTGVEITLDNLKIPRDNTWITDSRGNDILLLKIEMEI